MARPKTFQKHLTVFLCLARAVEIATERKLLGDDKTLSLTDLAGIILYLADLDTKEISRAYRWLEAEQARGSKPAGKKTGAKPALTPLVDRPRNQPALGIRGLTEAGWALYHEHKSELDPALLRPSGPSGAGSRATRLLLPAPLLAVWGIAELVRAGLNKVRAAAAPDAPEEVLARLARGEHDVGVVWGEHQSAPESGLTATVARFPSGFAFVTTIETDIDDRTGRLYRAQTKDKVLFVPAELGPRHPDADAEAGEFRDRQVVPTAVAAVALVRAGQGMALLPCCVAEALGLLRMSGVFLSQSYGTCSVTLFTRSRLGPTDAPKGSGQADGGWTPAWLTTQLAAAVQSKGNRWPLYRPEHGFLPTKPARYTGKKIGYYIDLVRDLEPAPLGAVQEDVPLRGPLWFAEVLDLAAESGPGPEVSLSGTLKNWKGHVYKVTGRVHHRGLVTLSNAPIAGNKGASPLSGGAGGAEPPDPPDEPGRPFTASMTTYCRLDPAEGDPPGHEAGVWLGHWSGANRGLSRPREYGGMLADRVLTVEELHWYSRISGLQALDTAEAHPYAKNPRSSPVLGPIIAGWNEEGSGNAEG